MKISWFTEAWEEYLEWMDHDRRKQRKIESLIRDILRNGPLDGIGKPEVLRYRKGYSRRIDGEHRLVYDIDEDGDLVICSCKGHYEE